MPLAVVHVVFPWESLISVFMSAVGLLLPSALKVFAVLFLIRYLLGIFDLWVNDAVTKHEQAEQDSRIEAYHADDPDDVINDEEGGFSDHEDRAFVYPDLDSAHDPSLYDDPAPIDFRSDDDVEPDLDFMSADD